MGMIFENLTNEELCELMCGSPEYEQLQKVAKDGNLVYSLKRDILNESSNDLNSK